MGPRSAGPEQVAGTSTNGERGKYGLGAMPEMDMSKAEELCGLEEGMSISLRNRLVFYEGQILIGRSTITPSAGNAPSVAGSNSGRFCPSISHARMVITAQRRPDS